MKKSTKKLLRNLWGYLLLAAVACFWFVPSIGPGAVAILSALVVAYCLFQAPMWCCADIRGGGLCRNNAYGILLGCHIRQHKGQKLRMAVRQQYWGRLVKRIFSSIGGQAATFSAVAGLISASAATVTLLVKKSP
ncbi:hypothetical protein [Amycolatopsis sp. H20-H5]|uniref:hypothetical protein n=1 Tax=Amycolatopsis sp. H20-H5 TaxID=3046309 RepID=UPI002DB9E602|nr:hypothetical protein [Amycolatopsis sp. H20-H5]MEC3980770.1 hypothetical protein [Amycolatopsis sp. H20-H5]